jgi:hypothetical protein
MKEHEKLFILICAQLYREVHGEFKSLFHSGGATYTEFRNYLAMYERLGFFVDISDFYQEPIDVDEQKIRYDIQKARQANVETVTKPLEDFALGLPPVILGQRAPDAMAQIINAVYKGKYKYLGKHLKPKFKLESSAGIPQYKWDVGCRILFKIGGS